MNDTPGLIARQVAERMNRFDSRLIDRFGGDADPVVGGVGFYTGLGVSDSDDPDIIVAFSLYEGEDMRHIDSADPAGQYLGEVWARLPGHPEIAPVLVEVIQHAQAVDTAAAFLLWCAKRFADKTDASMAALGYG
jgi:hypothetical protein